MRYAYPLILIWWLLFSACVGSAPNISEIRSALVFRSDPSAGAPFESLSIYALVADTDGIHDLDEMYVLHDEEALFWKVTSEEWDIDESEDMVWIGSHLLRAPHARILPRGEYRLQIYDRAGEIATRDFFIFENSTVDDLQSEFPTISYDNGSLNLSSEYDDNIVRWYYRGSESLYDYEGASGIINVQEVAPELSDFFANDDRTVANLSSFYIYSYPTGRRGGYYILIGPIVI